MPGRRSAIQLGQVLDGCPVDGGCTGLIAYARMAQHLDAGRAPRRPRRRRAPGRRRSAGRVL